MKIRKFFASKVEWQYIYQLIDAIKDENIRNYLANQIQWHAIKAYWYRALDNISRLLTILMPMLVVVVQQMIKENDSPVSQAVILAGATVTSAAGVFSRWNEKKILYRKTTELLKEETILYVTHTGQYKSEKRDERFIMEIRKIVCDTNTNWGKIEEKTDGQEEQQMEGEG